jgi:hypothetical protein
MFRSAGNRRFVVRSALAATVVGLFVAPQLASASHGDDDGQAQVSDDSTPDSTDDSVDSTTPDSVDDDTSSSTPTSIDDDTTPDTTEDSSTPDSTPDTTEDSSTPDTTEDSSTPDSIDDDDQVPPIAPFSKTYTTNGGSVTVTFDGSSLSLSGVTPAPGFVIERQEARGDRVRVRFESDDNRSEIEVGFHDGELREEVEED